ncbi:MAG: hypothetical protein M1839_003272 [Geoglossum umbratile]|nr:MAG: hypothetical protein M1839_003272 [Geoglossum umbratile]
MVVKTDDGDTTFRIATVAANRPIPPDSRNFYFEITITNGGFGALAIGLWAGDVVLGWFPGQLDQSWGYISGGFIWNAGSGPQFRGTYGPGDKVGCLYNSTESTVSFTKNGEYLGIAFRGVKGKLFPTFATNKRGVEARVDFKAELPASIRKELQTR